MRLKSIILVIVAFAVLNICSPVLAFQITSLREETPDQCKSLLMGIIFENFKKDVAQEYINEMHKIWTKIYQTIGFKNIPGHEILRFAASLKQEIKESLSRPFSSEDALDWFATFCGNNPITAIDMSEWLLNVTKALHELYSNRRLKAVTTIAQARLLAVSLFLADQLDENERVSLLDQWERVSFRIFGMCRKDSRSKVGDYTRLAVSIIRNQLDYDEIMQELRDLGKEYPIEDCIKEIAKHNCYNGWEEELRYFLYRYEESNYSKKINQDVWNIIWNSTPSTTIEHICPQSAYNNNLRGWKSKLGRSPKVVTENIQRLGNLTLLPPDVNTMAGQKSFKEKVKIYKEKAAGLFIVSEVCKETNWNIHTMEAREKRLLDWARTAWDDI